MSKLSRRNHEILDMIFYLWHQLNKLLEAEQAIELESFLASQFNDFDTVLTPSVVTNTLKQIRKYEPVRNRLEKLAGVYLLQYEGPSQPPEEGPIIPLGAKVICQQDGHDIDGPYITRIRKQGQRCPIHNVFLVPYKGTK